ncbi:hypothetical protein Moror_874 [Moniliophthora roreri MCA 2997]|uniref:Uncharacterized protein n=2 Tax=Moniliophthora roreri TaxID=221103 RepID=V2XAJ4_MONRO|nr:hypothetical protein Moror_874 [Moniliophthora roreri MCA 2997]
MKRRNRLTSTEQTVQEPISPRHFIDESTPLINCLPPEILSEIFLNMVLTRFGSIHHARFAPQDTGSHSIGSYVGRVCSYWRNVSLRTPALWSSFYIRISPCTYSGLMLQRLQCHLVRSGSHPLSVAVFLRGGLTLQEQDVISCSHTAKLRVKREHYLLNPRRMLEIIFKHAERIYSLTLVADVTQPGDNIFVTRVVSSLSHRFPVLTSLKIIIPHYEDIISLLNLFAEFSSIQNLMLNLLYCPVGITERCQFPLNQITNIELRHASVDTIWDILPHCRNIQTADFHFYQYRVPRPRKGKLSVPYIHTLRISFAKPTHLGVVMNMLNDMTFPRLSSFSFDAAGFHTSCYEELHRESWNLTFLNPVLRIVSSSTSGLRTLRLNRAPFGDAHLLPILRKTPDLEELDVTDMGYNGVNYTVTSRLLKELSGGAVVPRLRKVGLVIWTEWKGDGIFEGVLEARMKREPKLHTAYAKVVGTGAFHLDMGRLRRLQKEGLAVRVVQVSNIESNTEVEVVGYGRDGGE